MFSAKLDGIYFRLVICEKEKETRHFAQRDKSGYDALLREKEASFKKRA